MDCLMATSTTETPAAADAGMIFRKVLGHLPTGVVVIASDGPSGRTGIAVNSFTAVSLDPALVSICVARTSTTWPAIRAAGRFCISILADHHEQASRQFSARNTDRFAGTSWHDQSAGPALDDAVAWLNCEMYAEYAAGDHTIVVARVHSLSAAEDGSALVFFRGRYGRFVPNPQPPTKGATP
ncbi:monooxygenase [Rhodococcus sp. 06-418-5]|nr:monooxygenase [Rhodococcus sp. 06-418-5]